MNILHLTLGIPELRSGGLISYAYSVASTEAGMGHIVTMIYPGKRRFHKKSSEIKKSKMTNNISIYKIINPPYVAVPLGVKNPEYIMQPGNRRIYQAFLNTVKPDLVHIHTYMGFHKEFIEDISMREIPIVYTTHDYYLVCPKTSRVDYNNHNCSGAVPDKCARCNSDANNSMLLQYVLQSEWYIKIKKSKIVTYLKRKRKKSVLKSSDRYDMSVEKTSDIELTTEVLEQYRKLLQYQTDMFEYVDIVHCNSTVSEEMYTPYFGDKKHFVLNITTQGVKDFRKLDTNQTFKINAAKLNIGFIGISDFHKGYWILRDAGEILYMKGLQFNLIFFGDEFDIDTERYPFCKNKGTFDHNNLPEVMKTLDILVVPGFWYETFGLSAMEAVANGVPVLVSTHTGSKDLLNEVITPHLFDPDPKSLAELLEQYIENPELLELTRSEQDKIRLTFSMSEHVMELLENIDENVQNIKNKDNN